MMAPVATKRRLAGFARAGVGATLDAASSECGLPVFLTREEPPWEADIELVDVDQKQQRRRRLDLLKLRPGQAGVTEAGGRLEAGFGELPVAPLRGRCWLRVGEPFET